MYFSDSSAFPIFRNLFKISHTFLLPWEIMGAMTVQLRNTAHTAAHQINVRPIKVMTVSSSFVSAVILSLLSSYQ